MKILIIKTGALGDVLRSTFIAQALKQKYKDSKISWLTSKEAKDLFLNNPYVDNVLVEKSIIKNDYNIVINLEESEDLCKLASSLKPKEVIGFYNHNGKIESSPTAKEWFDMSALGEKPKNDILKAKNTKTHRQILSEIVGVKNDFEPFLRLTEWQRGYAKSFMRQHNLSRSDIIIGLNLGGGDRWPKQLPEKKAIELINNLNMKYKTSIILFGGPNEVERNKRIIQNANAPIISAGCGNDLKEFPSLISICNIVITTDSLGLHVALALKRKTIALIGPTSSAELDMYGVGKKVIPDSNCLCCYKGDCKSMDKIDTTKIIDEVSELLKQTIILLITAFKEPNIGKAIESAMKQKTKYKYQIIVSAPDDETINIAKEYGVNVFRDPGKGKSFALNMIFEKIKTDILILTDGDVFLSENCVENIANLFLDPEIGCVTGRPIPVEEKDNMFGYWSNFLFESAHRIRKDAFENNKFIECSGYLFAFRKELIKKIPLDVAEDTVIPYMFWERGYMIGYAENAKVFVKNVDNWKDWIKQKTRTTKAHETLNKYVDTRTTKKVKSFSTEFKGLTWLFSYPKNLKEFYWSLCLAAARGYMWLKVFLETRFIRKHYTDNWERIDSAR